MQHQHRLVEPLQVRVDAAAPGVAVRLLLDQARLLVLKTAWLMDTQGNKAARREIAMIKAVVPQMALNVIDRAIQVHGGGGVSQDFPLAQFWIYARSLRLADGPDEVHLASISKMELK